MLYALVTWTKYWPILLSMSLQEYGNKLYFVPLCSFLFSLCSFLFCLSAIIPSTIVVLRNWIPFPTHCNAFPICASHCPRPFTKESHGFHWSRCAAIFLFSLLSLSSPNNFFIFLFSLFLIAISLWNFSNFVLLCFAISEVEKGWMRMQIEKLKFCFLIIFFHEVFPCPLIKKRSWWKWTQLIKKKTLLLQCK